MARQTINAVSTKHEYRKFFAVLFFIALIATVMSTLIAFRPLDWVRWFVGSFLLVFGGFKLISYESFIEVFPRYDPLAARYKLYAYAYPLIEVLLGIFYILDMASGLRYIVTFILVAFGLMGMLTNLDRQGPSAQHTWLGNFLKLPMSTAILFEDLIIAVLAALLVVTSIFS